MIRATTRLAIAAALAAALAAPASAHHGNRGAYDVATPIAVVGTVTGARFAPPHPVITVRVDPRPVAGGVSGFEGRAAAARAGDAGRTLEIEFSPLPAFTGLSDKVAVGQRIEILAFRNCRAPHDLRGQWVRTASGHVAQRDGRPTAAVDGCANAPPDGVRVGRPQPSPQTAPAPRP